MPYYPTPQIAGPPPTSSRGTNHRSFPSIQQLQEVEVDPRIAGLEEEASQLGSLNTGNQEDLTQTHARPPPLNNLVAPTSKKRKRHLQPSPEDPASAPQEHSELMKKSVAELAQQAALSSKGAMSDDDRDFFLKYQEEQRKELLVQCIERGVSLPMVDKLLGKRIPVKGINIWNEYMKTEEARAVFRDTGNGVNDKSAMSKVSAMWDALPSEAKKAFAPATRSPHDSDQPPDNEPQSNTGPTLKGTSSFKRALTHVENYLDNCIQKANNIAQTCNAEFIFMAVSKHLGPYSFQLTKTTPGAQAFVQFASNIDGPRNYPARLQAHIMGHSVQDVAQLAGKTEKAPTRNHTIKFTDRMCQLIAEKTEGVMQQWPWTNNDSKLAAIGYSLSVSPNARIDPAWLKRPSRHMQVTAVKMLQNDLDDGLIDLVRVTRSAAQRSNSESSDVEENDNTPNS